MQRYLHVLIVSLLWWSQAWCMAAQSATTVPTDRESKPSAIKAPSTLEEIAARRAAAAAILDKLRPTTQSTTTLTSQAATQPEGTVVIRAGEFWKLIIEYDKLLEQQEAMHARIAEFKNDAAIRRFNDEIAEIREKSQRIAQRLAAPPATVATEELRQARELFDTINREQDRVVKAETALGQALIAFPQRRKEVAAAVSAAQKQLDNVLTMEATRGGSVQSGAQRDLLFYERREAEIRLEMALSRLVGLGLEETLTTLQQQQDRRRVLALQQYAQSQRQLVNALLQVRTAGERGLVEYELRRAKTPYEKIFWEARSEMLKAYQYFRTMDNALQDRHSEAKLGRIAKRIARRDNYWQIFLESLPRRSGAEVLSKFHEIRKEFENESKELDRYRADLYLTLDERQGALTRRDELVEVIDDYRERLLAEVGKVEDEKASKMPAEFEERRQRFITRVDTLIATQDEAISRLTTVIRDQEQYCLKLERYRSRLYWAYLVVRDQGLLTLSLADIRKEWAGGAESLRQALRAFNQKVWEQLGDVGVIRWLGGGGIFFLSLPLALLARRRWRIRSEQVKDRIGKTLEIEGPEAAGISDRIELACLRVFAETVLMVLPLGALLVGLRVIGLKGDTYRLAGTLILFLLGIRIGLGIVRRLFMVSRPRYRIIRCSNKVASYYRTWSRAILYGALVTAPLPLLLELLNIMPATRTYLWQVSKSVALATLLVFLLRKRLVMKIVGRPEEVRARWLYLLVSWCYPLIVLGVAVMLGLEVWGYGALTTYVILKSGCTVATIFVGSLLSRYVSDQAQHYIRRLESRAAEGEAPDGSSHTEGGASKSEEWEGTRHFVAMAAWLFRWVVRVVGAVIILKVWGITLIEVQDLLSFRLAGSGDRALTLWRMLAASAAIVVSLLVSRSLRSVLQVNVYPEYPHLDAGGRATINLLLHYALIVVGAYIALQLIHIDLGALTVLMGTLGLGLGLGLQPLFVNFVSGLMILFERHIKVGDVVEVGDKIGEVSRISMRSTSIKTFDNIVMVIPNSEFITSKAVNWSLPDRRVRGDLDVGVAYGSDVDLVRRLLLRAAAENPKVLKEPAPAVSFTAFGDNALAFRLVVWFSELAQKMEGMTELRFAVNRLFEESGVAMPFPQRTLSIAGDKPLSVEIVAAQPKAPAVPGAGEPKAS